MRALPDKLTRAGEAAAGVVGHAVGGLVNMLSDFPNNVAGARALLVFLHPL